MWIRFAVLSIGPYNPSSFSPCSFLAPEPPSVHHAHAPPRTIPSPNIDIPVHVAVALAVHPAQPRRKWKPHYHRFRYAILTTTVRPTSEHIEIHHRSSARQSSKFFSQPKFQPRKTPTRKSRYLPKTILRHCLRGALPPLLSNYRPPPAVPHPPARPPLRQKHPRTAASQRPRPEFSPPPQFVHRSCPVISVPYGPGKQRQNS